MFENCFLHLLKILCFNDPRDYCILCSTTGSLCNHLMIPQIFFFLALLFYILLSGPCFYLLGMEVPYSLALRSMMESDLLDGSVSKSQCYFSIQCKSSQFLYSKVVLPGRSVPEASMQICWFILALILVQEFHFFMMGSLDLFMLTTWSVVFVIRTRSYQFS